MVSCCESAHLTLRSMATKTCPRNMLLDYEVGYRALVTPKIYLDFAVFHNEYDDLVEPWSGQLTVDPSPTPDHFTSHFP